MCPCMSNYACPPILESLLATACTEKEHTALLQTSLNKLAVVCTAPQLIQMNGFDLGGLLGR